MANTLSKITEKEGAAFQIIIRPISRNWKKIGENKKTKELIALAVAHAVQCPYCIDAYTQASLEKGSNKEQMTEAIHVAAAIKGGAALVHGVQMKNSARKTGM